MHDRHLRRLVACHACGRTTHPLEKTFGVTADRKKKPGRAKAPGKSRPCANCGETIGKLQATKAWAGKSVCHGCHAKLAAEAVPATPPQPAKSLPAAILPDRMVASPAPRAASPSAPAALELSIAPLAPVLLLGATMAAFFAAVSVMSYVGGFVSALLLVAVAAVGLRWLRRGTLSVRARLDQIEAVRLRYGAFRVVGMLLAWLWSQPARSKPWALLLTVFWAALYTPYCVSGMLLPVPRKRVLRVAA
jgi:hypothetical protein